MGIDRSKIKNLGRS